ncbi:MAG TPA: molybdate ABC transporter substrate-binding protein [Longimicrobium sp.]|jgi:molybdate transport system substrate-binding protein|uniref:molybdate ABC transporter substrate-binding protein n=1 Tax=Longimicrobium sp. TaxID=2029185 RepID=UPI002ED9A6DB
MNLRTSITPILAALLLAACGGKADAPAKGDREVVVFAAASLREAMQELAASFTKSTGTPVSFNFAGSNDLAHQINAARGMDLFVSASEAWMDTVQSAGRIEAGTRRDLLANSLVIVGHSRATWTVDQPCALATVGFEHIAMGDPDAVPAGTYARKWMQSVDCGGKTLWDGVKDRVAPAPDVRAALGLVLADPGVVGAVYRTDQMVFAGRTRVLFEVSGGPPIRYAMALVADGGSPEAGRRFADFIARPEAARVFARHGFIPLAAKP